MQSEEIKQVEELIKNSTSELDLIFGLELLKSLTNWKYLKKFIDDDFYTSILYNPMTFEPLFMLKIRLGNKNKMYVSRNTYEKIKNFSNKNNQYYNEYETTN